MKSDQEVLDRSLARYGNPPVEQVESAVAHVWTGLAAEIRKTQDNTAFHFTEDRPTRKSRRAVLAVAAAALLIVGLISTAVVRNVIRLSGPTALVETVDSRLYRVSGEQSYSIAAGERIATGETVRSGGGAVLALADGSRAEMRTGTEFRLESAGDGARIRLNRGSIIVSAEKQHAGHLYVQTKDVTVSVVGTIFLVSAEEEGSRVGVIQGQVRVLQGAVEKTLMPGDQVATVPAVELNPLSEEISWSRNAQEHIALLLRTEPLPPLPTFQSVAPSRISGFDAASLKVESQPPNGARAADLQGLSCTGRDGVWRAMMSTGLTSFSAPRGRCVGQYINIQMLVAALYDVPLARVAGAPNWRTEGHPFQHGFRIEAVAENPAAVTTAQLREMLKDFLGDRFGLKVRPEMRDTDGFALVSVGADLKLRGVPDTEEMLPTFEEDDSQQVIKGKTSLQKLANFLNKIPPIRCTFVDKTGLPGLYDYTLTLRLTPLIRLDDKPEAIVEWKKKEAAREAERGPASCGGPQQSRSSSGGALALEYTPPFATALQQQLGVKLEPQKVSVDYIVIDEVHEPREN